METRIIPPAQASARQTEMGDTFNRILFDAVDALHAHHIPYALIGGIAASGMGRPRSTHDIDVFVRPEDAEAALEALKVNGFEIERTDPRWLFKGWKEEMMVDIVFKSSGDIYFDDEMHQRAQLIPYHGRQIPAVAPEDLVIIKAAVHNEIGPHHWHDALAILSHATLDWQYLLKRARRAPRRLLALLIYAQSNDIWIPNNVIIDLVKVLFGSDIGSKSRQPEGYLSRGYVSQGMSQDTISGVNRTANHQISTQETRQVSTQATSTPHSEAYLAGHIQEALATDSRTAALDIQITIGEKMVLLKGEVPSLTQKRALEAVIRDQAQGFDIDNQVRITEVTGTEVEEVV